MTTFVSYNIGDWVINLQNTWLSGFSKISTAGQLYAAPRVNAFDTMDVTLDSKFDFVGGVADPYFSLQNIGNTQPSLYPTSPTNFGLSYPAYLFESALGCYFMIGIVCSL